MIAWRFCRRDRCRAMSSQESAAAVTTPAILAAGAEIGALSAGGASLPLILAALCNPASDAVAVARVIAQEPGLAARVLRVANSAYYGLSGQVATLERAFVLLGVDAVRGIAAAACLDRTAARALDQSLIDLSGMLRHSVATAAAAEALARAGAHRRLAAEAFIVGLLHDFGVAVQPRIDRAAFTRMIAGMQADATLSVREAEALHGCVGHERAAAVIFEAWKLPPNLVAAVRHHHDPLAAPAAAQTVCALVCVGDHLSQRLGLGYALEPVPRAAIDACIDLLGLDGQAIDRVAGVLPARVAELQSVLAGDP